MGRLKWNETLGRKVRDEPWEELTVSTYRRIRDAIGEGSVDDAVGYVEYFHEEALVHKRMYDQWIRDSKRFMGLKGFTDEELGELTERLNRTDLSRRRSDASRGTGNAAGPVTWS